MTIRSLLYDLDFCCKMHNSARSIVCTQISDVQSAARAVEGYSAKGTIRLLHSAAYASHYSPAVATLAASPCLLFDFPAEPRSVGQLLWALAILNLRPCALLGRLHALMSGAGELLSGLQTESPVSWHYSKESCAAAHIRLCSIVIC